MSDKVGDGQYSSDSAWSDFDNDGFLNLYVVNGNDPGTVNTANFRYRDHGNDNGWLKWTNVANFTEGSGVHTENLPDTHRRFYRLR